MNTTTNRTKFTTALETAAPGRFTAHLEGYLAAESHYRGNVRDYEWALLASGGIRLIRTPASGIGEVVTTLPDAEAANLVRSHLSALNEAFAANLYPLAVAAAGTPVDLPRLAAHIWETGQDPWDLPSGAARVLADLARVAVDLPGPVASAIREHALAPWQWFGPVLVPAKVSWYDTATGDDEVTEFDISAVLATVPTAELVDNWIGDGSGGHDPAATLSWLDAGAQQVLTYCDLEEGVCVRLDKAGRAAVRNWLRVHRPDELAETFTTE